MRILVILLLLTLGVGSFSVMTPKAIGATTSVLVLCDGKVMDGYTKDRIVLKEGCT